MSKLIVRRRDILKWWKDDGYAPVRETRVFQFLIERTERWYGNHLEVSDSIIDKEEVPQWHFIDLQFTGTSEWRSKFYDYIGKETLVKSSNKAVIKI